MSADQFLPDEVTYYQEKLIQWRKLAASFPSPQRSRESGEIICELRHAGVIDVMARLTDKAVRSGLKMPTIY